ncbi:MAG: FmdE family protein, partial [Anaerovorax sp.]
MISFHEDLERAVKYHGHLCSGQVLGVRMARMGMRLLGIEDPDNFRDLIAYVETDRCIADAVGTVTGCKLGRR